MKEFVRFDRVVPQRDGYCWYWGYGGDEPCIAKWSSNYDSFVGINSNHTYCDPEYWAYIEQPILRDALLLKPRKTHGDLYR